MLIFFIFYFFLNQKGISLRDLYNIVKNEFVDEEMDEKKLDLFELIKKEQKGLKNNFREYIRGKIIDVMFAIQ